MLCENCGNKNATSIFMPPNNNKLKYLCGECYKKINSSNELENLAYIATNEMKLNIVCNNCGTSYKDFESSGLLGCEHCYVVYKNYISNFLLKFKEQKYLGRKPNLYYVQTEIKNLEQIIELCLKNGNLQKATIYGKELEKLKEASHGKL